MSGSTPPTEFALKGNPHLKHTIENSDDPDLKHKITSGERLAAAPVPNVPSFAPITAARSGDGRPNFWRRAGTTAPTFEILLPAIAESYAELNRDIQEGITSESFARAAALIKPLVLQNASTKEIWQALEEDQDQDQDHNFTGLMEYLKTPLANQFIRNIGTVTGVISGLSDVSIAQKFDLFDSYEPKEIFALFNFASFAVGKQLILDDPKFRFVKNNPSDPNNPTILYNGELDKKTHMMSISFDDDSAEGIAAQADFVAKHSQGNTNTFRFTAVGDPIAFMQRLEEFVWVKHLHCPLSAAVIRDQEAKLRADGYDENSQVWQRWEELKRDSTIYNPHTSKALNVDRERIPGISNTHTNIADYQRRRHQEFVYDGATIAAPTPEKSNTKGISDDENDENKPPVSPKDKATAPKVPDPPDKASVTLKKG